MTFDMVMMLMGWPYDSFDCVLYILFFSNMKIYYMYVAILMSMQRYKKGVLMVVLLMQQVLLIDFTNVNIHITFNH